MNDSLVKHKLLDACHQYVNQRISTATQAMNDAQQSANEEGKSSAGDKYETGRAMMQIERDKAAYQLEEAQKLKQILDQIDPSERHNKILLGSLAITEKYKIFIAVGAGKLLVEGDEFFVVGQNSPLAKTISGLKVDERFTFNNQMNTIVEIL